ncbi:hypothetical protein HW572_08345, partial [Gordonia amicalis]|nr:hypothetical protein [Gordonia amicalis]
LGGSDLGSFSWEWKNRIASICKAGDPVCSFIGTSLQSYRGIGVTIHGSYLGSNWLATAANWIKFDRFPSDTPVIDTNTTTINGRQGTAINHKLVATSGSRCSINWHLSNGATMPAGIQLTKAGIVRGTPTVSGTYSVAAKATADCPPGRADRSAITNVSIKLVSKYVTYGNRCKPGTPIEITRPPVKIGEYYDEWWYNTFDTECNEPSDYGISPLNPSLETIGLKRIWLGDATFGPDGAMQDERYAIRGLPHPPADGSRPSELTFTYEYTWTDDYRWPSDLPQTKQVFVVHVPIVYQD